MDILFKCDFCQERFSVKSNLLEHLRIHLRKIYQCSSCPIVFSQEVFLEDHILTHKEESAAVLMKNDEKEKTFLCGICKKCFAKNSDYIDHVINALEGKSFTHSNCLEKGFSEKVHLKSHRLKYAEERPFYCETCGENFTRETDLNFHLKVHSDEKPLLATEVDRVAFSNENSSEGLLLSHSENKFYECSTCGKTFSKRCELKYHTRVHTKERPYKCHICAKAFAFRSSLNSHVRETHEGIKFACDVCQKTFSKKGSLSVHLRIHSGENSYKCDLCQKRFSQKAHLKTHFLIHTGERPFHCEICGKTFARKNDFGYHLRSHSKERPFKCDKCDKSFKLKHKLTTHRRSHDESFLCNVCQKTFCSKNSLRFHFRKHSGENPFECSFCKKGFYRKDYMERHLRIHEKENP